MDGGTVTGIAIGLVSVGVAVAYGQYSIKLSRDSNNKFENQNEIFLRFKAYINGELNSLQSQRLGLIEKKESAIRCFRDQKEINMPVLESELGSISGSLEVMGQRLQDLMSNIDRYKISNV